MPNTLIGNPLKLRHLIIFTVTLMLLSACSFTLAEDIPPPPGSEQQFVQETEPVMTASGPLYPIVPPDPNKGEVIYAEKCAPCHGATGLGNGPRATELTVPVTAIGSAEVARQSTPAAWYTVLTEGNLERFMPPFPSLSDRQKWDVIAYVYDLSTSKETAAQGEVLYEEYCASCHGLQGSGAGEQASQLASDPIDFTDLSYMAAKSSAEMYSLVSSGLGAEMPSFEDELSDAERWAVADYLRTLMFASPMEEALEVQATGISAAESEETQEMIGDVTVQLVNGTGGEVPSDLEVTLYGFDNMQMVYSETVKSGESGNYLFDGVEMATGRAYLAAVDYQGSTYGSDVAVAEDISQPLSLPIVIYETMTDTSALSVDRIHIFFDFLDQDLVQVVELFIISNPADRAVIAEEEGGPILEFSLPEGATNLEFQDGALGERYIKTTEGFADTLRVPPGFGEYQVLFAFEMPYESGLDFAQEINLPANALVVLLPDVGVRVRSDYLQEEGLQDVQGQPYRMYNGGSLSAGSTLALDLSGRPKTSGLSLTTPSTQTSLVIGVGAFGLALIVAGVWLYVRNRGRQVEDEVYESVEGDETEASSAMQDSETVMDAIIALDDMYQAGDLPDEAYQKRRMELKARFKEMLEQEEAQDTGV